ncbi:restriction endonuclease subunit S [Aeromonas media]|nr:restriction endonuclease subunit S [Aeromonas media]AHX61985.1 restriction modification system DNA specificity domain-containing protein [Aeromonas media WS]QQQ14828.1 restriction endonuclease subunit S [Aeromonas media]
MKAVWEVKNLGDVCHLIGGGTPSKDNADFYTGYIPWATVRDMHSDVITDTEYKITESAIKNSSTNIIPSGSVIIATRVGLGKVCLLNQDTAINQDLRGIFPKDEEKLSTRFLFWWLKSVSHLIVAEGTGATVQGVKLPFVKSLQIPLPPLSEQQRIVAILDEAFEAIAAARANADKNRQNARALFESYLQSVFSQRGEGWKKVPLGGLCDFLNGYAFKSDDATSDSNTQLVRMGNLYGNKLDLDRNPVFYPDNYAADYKRFILSPGDLVMSLTGTTGKEDYGFAVQIPEADRVLLLNQRIAKFDSIKEDLVCREYLLHYLRSRVFLDLLYPTANGTRQANLSTVTMKTLPVWLCSIPEQKTIVASLDAMQIDTQRLESLYQRKIAALDELKQSLLQQAFSGQLDTTRVEVLTP